MRQRFLNVFCAMSLLFVFPNWSYSQHLELIGRAAGRARDICVVKDYAYICAGGSLLILDLRDNANIKEIARIDTPGRLEAICIFGNYAYLADSNNPNGGIWIIDISDPKSPQNVAKIPHPANSIRISNSYAYFTSQNSLQIWDISNLREPKEVSRHFILMEPRNVQITDKYAYIVGWMGGLVIIDISNPYVPKEVSFFQSQDDIPEETKAIDVSGSYAYVAYKHSQSKGLRIMDLSDPSNPKAICFYDTGSGVSDICVTNNNAYIAAGNAGLIVLEELPHF